MSAEIESLYYTNEDGSSRNVPWHGLGTEVKQAPTSKEAIKLAGLDWNVVSTPVYANNQVIEGYKANIRDVDNKCLGIVGERYKIIQNSQAFEFTDKMLGEGVTYETAGSLLGGKRIWLLAKLPETKILDEQIVPYMVFTNGHDGFYSVKAALTPVRVVCQNTLNFALNSAPRSWSMRHVGDIDAKVYEAQRALNLASNYMTELSNTADVLANTKISEEEAAKVIEEVFPIKETDTERKVQSVEDARRKFQYCILAPDIAQYAGTAYQLAQAATDFANHVRPSRMTSDYQERNFMKTLDGNVFVDKVFFEVMKLAEAKKSFSIVK